MINRKLIRNYTSALFYNAIDCHLEDKVFEQITIINQSIFDNSKIKATMCSPIVNNSDKRKIIEAIAESFNIEIMVKCFLFLLVKNYRMSILPYIVILYYQLLYDSKNIKIVQITSCKTLQLEEKQWLRNYLEDDLKQKININFHYNQSIIGGLVIQYDSIIKDYSIKGSLKKIEKILKNTKIDQIIAKNC